jgi:energy-coupling factor transport system substrate-specific component
MAKIQTFTTRALLISAAIGVASGLAAAVWAPMHLVFGPSGIVWLYGLALGFHVLPGVVAQQVLRLPLVALITHFIAALVSIAFVPSSMTGFVTAAVVFGGVQELVSAATRYRHWETWRFLLSALITGVILAAAMWFPFRVSNFEAWQQIVFVAAFIVGPIVWALIGVGIGGALRRAGVVRNFETATKPNAPATSEVD